MALGTVLTAAVNISMTAGGHAFTFNSDGLDAANEILAADGTLTICLMDYYHDYLGNEPSGVGFMSRVYYVDHGTSAYRPSLGVTHGATAQTISPAGSGNDDDASLLNIYIGTSPPTWSALRGDETTSGTSRNDLTNDFRGVFSFSGAGRGSDQIRDLRRSYFAFDLSAISASGDADDYKFSCRMDRYQPTGSPTNGSDSAILIQATALAGDTSDYGNCFVADAVTVTHNATFFGANF